MCVVFHVRYFMPWNMDKNKYPREDKQKINILVDFSKAAKKIAKRGAQSSYLFFVARSRALLSLSVGMIW